MIDGLSVSMNGMAYVIPPLTLGALRRLREKLASLKDFKDGLPSDEQFQIIIEVIHTALARNYPEMTVDQVQNHLVDAGNMADVLRATMSASGMVQSKPGEGVSRS